MPRQVRKTRGEMHGMLAGPAADFEHLRAVCKIR
jgi:hypothetical protein